MVNGPTHENAVAWCGVVLFVRNFNRPQARPWSFAFIQGTELQIVAQGLELTLHIGSVGRLLVLLGLVPKA